MELTGTIPATPAGEVAVPASLFEARAPQLFSAEKRDSPVDMRYPSVTQDAVTFMLPAGATVKASPADVTVPFGDSARLIVKHTPEAGQYTVVRMLIQAKTFYGVSPTGIRNSPQLLARPASDYSDLKAFYAKVSAQDAEKIVITPAP